jgi:acyl carrier protein
MKQETNVLDLILSAVNEIKKTGFTADSVELDFYLGGDLGIDSREMFEVWYEIEERLGIKIEESEKRDRYKLEDVVNVIEPLFRARRSLEYQNADISR